MGVGEVIEAEVLGVLQLELNMGDEIRPVGAEAAEFTGLDREFWFGGGAGTDGDGGFGGAVVRVRPTLPRKSRQRIAVQEASLPGKTFATFRVTGYGRIWRTERDRGKL